MYCEGRGLGHGGFSKQVSQCLVVVSQEATIVDESHAIGRRVRGQHVGQLGLQGAYGGVDGHISHVEALAQLDGGREDAKRESARRLCHVVVVVAVAEMVVDAETARLAEGGQGQGQGQVRRM
jgi:hypothetical protein